LPDWSIRGFFNGEAPLEKAKKRLSLFLIFFLLLLAAGGLLLLPFMGELESDTFRETFSAQIAGLGLWGVALFYCIQVLQNLIAFIPGGPWQVIAGAAFGTWRGLFILQAGVLTSATIIFTLVRRFGSAPFTRFLGADITETWGFLKDEKKTARAVFILFIIPGLPKDAMTCLVALTKLPLAVFLPVSLAARFPGMLLSVMMGDAAMQGNWHLFAAVFGITAVAGILGIQFKERVKKALFRA